VTFWWLVPRGRAATSNLNSEFEYLIQEAPPRLAQGARSSLSRIGSRRPGEILIVESGPHAELVARDRICRSV
jgi:hypothetical protein